MLSLNPELIGDTEAIRRHLDYAAIDTSDLSRGGDPWNHNVWGDGRLDAFDAVSLLLIDGFESGDTSAWSMTVPWTFAAARNVIEAAAPTPRG